MFGQQFSAYIVITSIIPDRSVGAIHESSRFLEPREARENKHCGIDRDMLMFGLQEIEKPLCTVYGQVHSGFVISVGRPFGFCYFSFRALWAVSAGRNFCLQLLSLFFRQI